MTFFQCEIFCTNLRKVCFPEIIVESMKGGRGDVIAGRSLNSVGLSAVVSQRSNNNVVYLITGVQ